MSTTETILKDILEIHGRILEHRPVIQGDINFFIKEFEEKYKGQDLNRLRAVEEGFTRMIDSGVPECEGLLEQNTQNVLRKVKKATEMCDKIAEKEGTIEADFLRTQRESRAEEWAEFMKIQFEKSADVDRDFNQQTEAMKKHYQELEEKLKLPLR
ncbi:biogenesis of lysosome-related organelles complex 1 subunit 5-like [Liolophura sinensis]|uniref:biogenesis of lysosome-related organelles complex 1 subunit 5-like n=1 Tax=Liolophura sinensis TaxID=3198878 RepID=UPI0031585737